MFCISSLQKTKIIVTDKIWYQNPSKTCKYWVIYLQYKPVDRVLPTEKLSWPFEIAGSRFTYVVKLKTEPRATCTCDLHSQRNKTCLSPELCNFNKISLQSGLTIRIEENCYQIASLRVVHAWRRLG